MGRKGSLEAVASRSRRSTQRSARRPPARKEPVYEAYAAGCPTKTRLSREGWIPFVALAAVVALESVGVLGHWSRLAMFLVAMACAVWGVRRHGPTLRWPWLAMTSGGTLWAIGSLVRTELVESGDLSDGRWLLADLFTIPAYGLIGASLYALMRARRPGVERGALIDGVMVGAAGLLVVSELLMAPSASSSDTSTLAWLAVCLPPALAACLLVLASRLTFVDSYSSAAFRALTLAISGLVVGDILATVFEIRSAGTLRPFLPPMVMDLPHLLAAACLGAAALQPSIRFGVLPPRCDVGALGRRRVVALAAALLAPVVVVMSDNDATPTKILLCVLMAASVIAPVCSTTREQIRLEARLAHQATHDELTALPGRGLILVLIGNLLKASTVEDPSIAVMFVDLDHFKLVNDSMGHGAGDELLVEVAQRISSCMRPQDLVGRISGDEFIIVVEIDTDGALRLAERLRQVLGQSFQLEGGEVFATVSIGVTVTNDVRNTHAATLVQEADTAMSRSKDGGRNCVTLFDASMRESAARRVALERRLHHALKENQLDAHFQPLVILPSGRVQGFEALARWTDCGVSISPIEFIPVAEESGLIVELGAFMLEEACRHIAHWRTTVAGGERLYVSVNLSPRQLREGRIVETVADALLRHYLPGEALWLEITESVLMEDSLVTADVLAGLRRLGVRLSIDDFGTGYSSLSYLKRFPVSCVKIDREFVRDLGQDEADSQLVAAIIAMGTALDLDLLAEGVETADQAERLYTLGCRQAQGYLFSRPIAALDVPGTLDRLGIAGARRQAPPRRCIVSTNRN